MGCPKTAVDKSTELTSAMVRGMSVAHSKALRFRRKVCSASTLPAMESYARCVIFARAMGSNSKTLANSSSDGIL